MNLRHFLFRTAIGAGLLSSCTSRFDVGTAQTHSNLTVAPYTDPVSGTTFDISDPPSASEACPIDDLVGVWGGGGACPAALASPDGTWTAEPLFRPVAGAVPTGLSGYCRYTWQPAMNGLPPDTSVLPGGGLTWLTPDCKVVAALGHPYVEANATLLHDAFFAQVDALSALPKVGGLARVRVLMADSSIDALPPNPGLGLFSHGRTLGLLINALTCPVPHSPTSACLGGIQSNLALPLQKTAGGIVRNEAQGGFFGTFGDVARAIYEGARALEEDTNRTVINLSLGWNDVYGGDYASNPDELSAPLSAVHRALEYASCTSKIVVAAAGNVGGGPNGDEGPLFPAAWETREAPSSDRCTQLGMGTGPGASVTNYRPLLWAAAGVDGADFPLANGRVNSASRIVAPASHALVFDGATPLDPLSGTSVAAAVTSAAAAIMWSYNDTLSPFDVMREVYDAAVDLNRTADFCLSSPCEDSRRVSICRAVTEACALHGGCGALPACSPEPRDARPQGLVFPPSQKAQHVDASGVVPGYLVGPPCETTLFTDSAPDPYPCPSGQFYTTGSTPWTNPQPGEGSCPTCRMAFGTVQLGISSDLASTLSEPTLHVNDEEGVTTSYALPIASSALSAGAEIDVQNLGYDQATVESATIEFVVDGETSSVEPLLIE